MCYHTANPGKKELKKAIEREIIYEGPEIYHVSGCVRPYLPVTLNSDIDQVIPARWKLIPYWVKSEADAAKGLPIHSMQEGRRSFRSHPTRT